MEELLKCIAPIEYMMLRRACPIFIRNPARFPTVEEMGRFKDCFNENGDTLGIVIMMVLHGSVHHVDMLFNNDRSDGLYYYSKQTGLMVGKLDKVARKIYYVDTSDYAQEYLFINSSRNHIQHVVNVMFTLWDQIISHGFTVQICHPKNTIRFVSDKVDYNEDAEDGEEHFYDEYDKMVVVTYWDKFVKMERNLRRK